MCGDQKKLGLFYAEHIEVFHDSLSGFFFKLFGQGRAADEKQGGESIQADRFSHMKVQILDDPFHIGRRRSLTHPDQFDEENTQQKRQLFCTAAGFMIFLMDHGKEAAQLPVIILDLNRMLQIKLRQFYPEAVGHIFGRCLKPVLMPAVDRVKDGVKEGEILGTVQKLGLSKALLSIDQLGVGMAMKRVIPQRREPVKELTEFKGRLTVINLINE